jgi:nitroreductase
MQTNDVVLETLLRERFSTRGFLPDPVPSQTIDRILELAQRTASWCNVQPWEVVVTSGAATDGLTELLLGLGADDERVFDIEPPARYDGVFRDRRRASGFALYESVAISRDDQEGRARQARENFRFFGAPHVAIITTAKELGPYALVDCGGYVANFLLAATSLGVATIAQAAIANFSGPVRQHLGIPDERQVVCAISFGLADLDHPVNNFRTERASIDDVVRRVG